MLRNIDDDTIMSFRHKSQFLWEKYFSSVDVIIKTTFEVTFITKITFQSSVLCPWYVPGCTFKEPHLILRCCLSVI